MVKFSRALTLKPVINAVCWQWLLMMLLTPNTVLALCSGDYHGLAVINEVFKQSQGRQTDFYIEVKILSASLSNVDYDTWTLESCTASGCSGAIQLSRSDASNLPWIVTGKSLLGSGNYIDLSNGTFVILKDGNGDTIDYLSIAGYTNGIDNTCATAYEWQFPSSNTKNVRRVPDGAGNWDAQPGNSGGNTAGDDNTNSGGGGPEVVVNNVSTQQGQNLTFSVSLSASSGSDITVTYYTQDQTAIASRDYVGVASGSVVVRAGDSSANISVSTIGSGATINRTMRLILQSASTGSITGQVGVGTIIPPPAPSIDHFSISHSGSGVTCEAEAVTITAHDASHNPVAVTSDTSLTVTTSPAVTAILPANPVILSGDSRATLYINQSTSLSGIDIDVSGGSTSDLDDGGSEDALLSFAEAGFRFYADGNHTGVTPILTQVAGKPNTTAPGAQALTLRAVRTNSDTGACEAALQGSTTINIAYECNNPAVCTNSNDLSFSGSSTVSAQRNDDGVSLSYTPVSMQFDVNGEAPFSMRYADVGQLSLHARIDAAASVPEPAFVLEGSSNAFVVRPFGVSLDYGGQRSADYADDGLLNDSTGFNATWSPDGNGSAFMVAGQGFNLGLTAVVWQAADDSDSDGIPDAGANLYDNAITQNFGNETSGSAVTLSRTLVAPSGGDSGSFVSPVLTAGGGSSDFTNGVATASVSWDEVGIIDISASLLNYLGDSAANTTTTAASFGRFVPASFDVVVSDGSFAGAAGGFSYIGQSFGYDTVPSATIIARNALGGVTQNYTLGDFMKLTPSSIGRSFSGTDNAQLGADGLTLMAAATDMIAGSGTMSVLAPGQLSYTFDAADTFSFIKNSHSEIGPFISSLTINATSLNDADGVAATSLPSWSPAGIESRYGRWMMSNAFGPETESLVMRANVEYLNGSGNYEINTADNSTNITSLISTTPSGAAGAGEISGIVVGSGSTDLNFQAPLASGDAGWVFTSPYSLASPGANYTGVVDVQVDLSSLPWLRYDWVGSGTLVDHPGVSASFGQFRGHDRIIYWREVAP